ncbi:DgyrCDS8240 [Dimorphilus gyrociliatus]|uniref:DgyrCDS8240 n=1 Tax=Dimorphilus gyrociliatus TaxID=2664684 RepID=A0A7I8VTM2_9ANNE|nr:DgyrCDS8240 [Dimorphilus gyrociliatus]
MTNSVKLLEEIYVQNCNLTIHSIESLAQLTKRQRLLKIIDVSFNKLGDAGGSILFNSLTNNNKDLNEIYLNSCNLGVTACDKLSKALSRQPLLKILNVSNNVLDDEGALVLFTSLADYNRNLEKLFIRNCKFGIFGLKRLIKNMKILRNLYVLDISENYFLDEEISQLLTTIIQHGNICELYLKGVKHVRQRIQVTLSIINRKINSFNVNRTDFYRYLIKYQAKFHQLPIRGYNFGLMSSDKLFDAISTLNNLKVLDLSCNIIENNYELIIPFVINYQLGQLEKLYLRNCYLGCTEVEKFLQTIKMQPLLKILDISNSIINANNGASTIFEIISEFSHLENLYIRNCHLNQNGIKSLNQIFTNQIQLSTLDLSFTDIKEKGAISLFESISYSCNNIQELYLKACKFHSSGAKKLGNALKNQHKLRILDISYNKIGNDGAVYLFKSMKMSNLCLEVLIIDNCLIGFEGINELSKLIECLDSLKCLNVSRNPIKDEGGALLIDSICTNNIYLEELRLCNCKIGRTSDQSLSIAIKSLSYLKVLDVTQNKDCNFKEFLNSQHRNCNLNEIRIESSAFDQFVIMETFAQLVGNQSKLAILSLSNSSITNETLEMLLVILSMNSDNLEEFYLCNCNLTSKCSEILSIYIKLFDRLKILDLSENPFEDEGSSFLFKSLIDFNNNLEEVSLINNRFTSIAMVYLFEALPSLNNLRLIDLSNNKLQTPLTFNLLFSLNNIEELYLANCDIDSADSLQFQYSFQRLKCLRILDISHNRIGDDLSALILHFIAEHCNRIEELHIQYCNIEMEEARNHLLLLYENEFRVVLKNVVTFIEFCNELITKNILTIDHLDKFKNEIDNKGEFVADDLFKELFKILINTRTDWILICLMKTQQEQCTELAFEIANTWKRIIEELMNKFKTDYSTVPISPFENGNPIPVERVLTPMTIIKVNKTLLDEKLNKSFEESWNFLSIINDECKRIIVRGPPGIGKTVHMRKLVSWWANSTSQKPHLEMVLPLTLRKVRKGQRFIDAIWEQNNFHKIPKLNKEAFTYFLELKASKAETRNKIVFFLDGADEFYEKTSEVYDILNGKSFPFPIIVWSREWRAHQIELTYDAIFQLCGFNEKQLELYYIKCLDEERGRELVAYLKREKEDLFRVCSTPLLALIVWLVWKEPGNELSVNHYLIYEQFVNVLCSKMNINRKTKKFKKTLEFCYELAYDNLGKERIILNENKKGADRLQHAVNYLGGLLRVIKINYTNEQFHSCSQEFQFFHLTIQEYFAAKYIISKSNQALTDLLAPFCCGHFNFLSQLGKRLTDDGNVYTMLNVLRFVRALNRQIYDKLVKDNRELRRILDGVSDTIRKIITDGPTDHSLIVRDEELSNAIVKLLVNKYWHLIQNITLINAKANWRFLIKQTKSISFKNHLQVLEIKSNDALYILLKFLEVFESIETIQMENNSTKLTFCERRLKIKSYGWNEPEVDSLMTFVSLLNDIRSMRISVKKTESKFIPKLLDSLRYPNKIKVIDLSNSYLTINTELGGNDLTEEVVRIIKNFTHIEAVYLSNNNIFDQSIAELFKALSHPKNKLYQLKVNNCCFRSYGAEKLAKEMINLTNLKILDISDNKIDSKGSITLFKALNNCINNLEELHSRRCNIDWKGGESLADALRNFKKLTIIDISFNPIGTRAINKILESIYRFNSRMEKLNMESCRFDGGSTVFLAAVIEKLTNLTYFNISGNIMNKMSLLILFESMAVSLNEFKELWLNDINLWGDSVKPLLPFLQRQLHIEVIQLSNNYLSDTGVYNLFKTMSDFNIYIRVLDISNCNLGVAGAEYLAEAIKNQSYLQHLNVSFNVIEDEGAVVLFKSVALFCKSLQLLNVEKCGFGLYGAECLALVILKLYSLRTLIFSQNIVGEKGGELLFKMLSKSSCNHLKELRFRACQLRSSGGEHFAKALYNLDSLKILDCSSNYFNDQTSSLILESIAAYCNKLEILLIEDCQLSSNTFNKLNKIFITQLNLKILNISNNPIENNMDDTLFYSFPKSSSFLEEIHLQKCELNVNSIRQLCYTIQHITTLTYLNISNNHLEEEDAKYLFKVLSDSKNRLEVLLLQNCSLKEGGIDGLAEVLKKQTLLKTLNISYNHISNLSALSLSKSLACFCKECCNLRLTNTFSGSKATETIVKLIIRLPNLRILDLSLCKLENDGAINLFESLYESNIILEGFHLRHCNFDSHSMPSLIRALEKQHLLKILALSYNKLGNNSIISLFYCLSNFNSNLNELHLQGCGIEILTTQTFNLLLTEQSYLKLLNLTDNPIGDEGFENFIESFKQSCKYLTFLGLDQCGINNLDQKLSKELPKAKFLRKLT